MTTKDRDRKVSKRAMPVNGIAFKRLLNERAAKAQRVTPAEVWCAKCAEPSVREVDGTAYCEHHALEAEWKKSAPNWRAR